MNLGQYRGAPRARWVFEGWRALTNQRLNTGNLGA